MDTETKWNTIMAQRHSKMEDSEIAANLNMERQSLHNFIFRHKEKFDNFQPAVNTRTTVTSNTDSGTADPNWVPGGTGTVPYNQPYEWTPQPNWPEFNPQVQSWPIFIRVPSNIPSYDEFIEILKHNKDLPYGDMVLERCEDKPKRDRYIVKAVFHILNILFPVEEKNDV